MRRLTDAEMDAVVLQLNDVKRRCVRESYGIDAWARDKFGQVVSDTPLFRQFLNQLEEDLEKDLGPEAMARLRSARL